MNGSWNVSGIPHRFCGGRGDGIITNLQKRDWEPTIEELMHSLLFDYYYSWSSRKRPPRELEKVAAVTRAGRLRELLIAEFKWQSKRGFTIVFVTRAGRLRVVARTASNVVHKVHNICLPTYLLTLLQPEGYSGFHQLTARNNFQCLFLWCLRSLCTAWFLKNKKSNVNVQVFRADH